MTKILADLLRLPMPPTVFLSYSHEDEKWKDRLVKHLAGLERAGHLRTWNDRLIRAGEPWLPEIETAMEEARVAVLLVSADFLHSPFIRTREVPRLLERRAQEGIHVIPVIVKDCLWEEEVGISSLQARPLGGRALESFSGPKQNTELKKIAKEILDLVRDEVPPRPPQPISETAAELRPLHQLPSPSADFIFRNTRSEASSLRRFWRRPFTALMMGICILLAVVISLIALLKTQRHEASDHLAKAAEYLGLRDICLYSDPAGENAHVNLAKARREIEAAREAARWDLWGKDDLEVRAYQLEAYTWLFDRKYKNALQSIERGLAIDESSLGLIVDKAAVLRAQGRQREAEEELSKAYQGIITKAEDGDLGRDLDEDLACAAVSLALLRAELPDKAKSVEPLLEEALQRYPSRFITLWGYGQYLYSQNRIEEGLEYLERAARIDPTDAQNRLQIAEIHFNMAESGRVPIVHYRKARLHYKEGFIHANLLHAKLMHIDQMRVNFGKTLFHLGDVEAAKENLENGLLLGHYDESKYQIWLGNSFLLLSQVYACLQLWDSFEESLERGRRYNPALRGYLEQFRRDRQSDAAKWQPWGCEASLTRSQES